MRAVEPFFLHDIFVKLTGRAGWFQCVNIQACANTTISHRGGERCLVDHLASGCVDEVSARAHRAEEICAKQVLGFGIESKVNTDDIRRRSDGVWRFFQLNTEERRAL